MGFQLPLGDALVRFPLHYGLIAGVAIIVLWILGWVVYTRTLHPLSGAPGPFLASLTCFWYAWKVKQGNWDVENRALHRKYGRLVRITPSEVTVSDPGAIAQIYGWNSNFTKTDWYDVWSTGDYDTPRDNVFKETDEARHASHVKIFKHVWSMSNILESEPYMDNVTLAFLERLSEFSNTGKSFDFAKWVHMYGYDVIGELYFGKSIGFIETASDYGNYISSMETILEVMTVIGILPLYLRNLYMSFAAWTSRKMRASFVAASLVTKSAKRHVAERKAILDQGGCQERKDVLAKLLAIVDEKGEKVGFKIPDVEREAGMAIFAGADSVAIAMSSLAYQLLTHPKAYARLQQEIDDGFAQGTLTSPVKYAQAIKLPYLTVCIKEAMRIHPSVGLHLPRHVPEPGAEIAGYYLAPGWRVGMNAAVVHYDRKTFGHDADEFLPERWFRKGADKMDQFMFQYGGGRRVCGGRNIPQVEIPKLFAEMLHKFHLELRDPNKEAQTFDWWFHRFQGLDVKVRRRQ